MKKLQWIGFCLLIFTAGNSFAQSANREKVVQFLLVESRFRIHSAPVRSSEIVKESNMSHVVSRVDVLPRYALPKGNVVCRLEEYVQLHTPMKLNIGVGGQ
ncbi:MAG: hypothetical protein JSS76_05335 [Bacteroidetes bacterium]|nr:hypothetical protein [Bacteroidota bacterium]MBS1684154.1 hypothetical protein [Bacteroidota bacterium]